MVAPVPEAPPREEPVAALEPPEPVAELEPPEPVVALEPPEPVAELEAADAAPERPAVELPVPEEPVADVPPPAAPLDPLPPSEEEAPPPPPLEPPAGPPATADGPTFPAAAPAAPSPADTDQAADGRPDAPPEPEAAPEPDEQWDQAAVRALSPQLTKRAARLADALAAAAPDPVPAGRLATGLGVAGPALVDSVTALNRTAATTRANLPAPVRKQGSGSKTRYALDPAFAAHWPPSRG